MVVKTTIGRVLLGCAFAPVFLHGTCELVEGAELRAQTLIHDVMHMITVGNRW